MGMMEQYLVFTGYLQLLPLLIHNKKYLTLNLSKELNFIFTFLLKSYITLILLHW